MKVRDIIKLLEADGWYQVDTKGVIGNTNMLQSWHHERHLKTGKIVGGEINVSISCCH